MESSLFLIITSSSAILAVFSLLIQKNLRTKSRPLNRTRFIILFLFAIFTILFASLLASATNQWNNIMPKLEYESERISRLEEQIYELESMISSLEDENHRLQNQIDESDSLMLKYGDQLITFDTSDSGYSGSITPFSSVDGKTETVSIMLSPAEGYFIECVDTNNNLIETFSHSDGTWSFIMPNTPVTVFIKCKQN